MSLATLPEDCIALILSWTSPIDACRLACLCRSFATAARSNITWENLLPSDYRDIVLCIKPNPSPSPHPNPNPNSNFSLDVRDKRKVFQWLTFGVSLSSGLERYILLKRSAGVCRILSASAMGIAWGDDARFWRWEPSKSSCFSKVAHLVAVCWLEVNGKWKCRLPPGKYSVCWRLKFLNPQGGQVHFLTWKRPLRFSLSYLGVVLEKELDLLRLPSNGFEKWFEFEVGQIDVEGRQGNGVELNLEFGIQEIDCSFWKGGLFLDCLTLRPSYCDDTIYHTQPDKHIARIRGRPGVF